MYDNKIQTARNLIKSHNENVSEKFQVDIEDFIENLQQMGGTSEETLSACTWEDLQDCGLPKILSRRIANIFRKKNGIGSNKSSYVSKQKAESMGLEELIERYNPKDPYNAVGQRLKLISEGKKFLVFDDDGTLNVEESKKRLDDIIDGHEEIESIFIDDKPVTLYAVGERLDLVTYIDPIFKKPLRKGELCSITKRSWSNIEKDIKQLIYLAVHCTGELSVRVDQCGSYSNDIFSAHEIIDMAEDENAFRKISVRCPEAALYFKKKKKIGDLPNLMTSIQASRKIDKSNDPFYGNKVY